MRTLVLASALFLLAGPAGAQQDEANLSPVAKKIKGAMDSEIRSEEERERDDNRLPLQTLEFFGLREDMRVLELIPGGGWYTKLLGPVLADEGELYVAIGTSRVAALIESHPELSRVKVLEVDTAVTPTETRSIFELTEFSFDLERVDLALTFRNMHNFTPESRGFMNAAVFEALKPGGHYGIVDHTRRHMQPLTLENRRRADPVEIIKEVLEAGFEFVGYSDLHYRPDDELLYEVGRKTVTGNTDRFTFLFRKPG